MRFFPRLTLAIGMPGAYINHLISRLVHEKGCVILWPEQNIKVTDGKRFLTENLQNIEVHNIHKNIIRNFSSYNSDDLFCDYYPIPNPDDVFPGPKEFLSRFKWSSNVVVSDNLLLPFLHLWLPYAHKVYEIDSSEEEDLEALKKWTRGEKDVEELKRIRKVFAQRSQKALFEARVKPAVIIPNSRISQVTL